MGAHSSVESLMAGVESDALRVKAAALAVQMHGWLTAPTSEWTPLYGNGGDDGLPECPDSDLVEWCRSACDVLEAVGRG